MSIKISFRSENIKIVIPVPEDVALAIPLVRMSLDFKEGRTGRFEFNFETTREDLCNYLLYKASCVRKTTFETELTPYQWGCMAKVAEEMGDFEFFNDTAKFPSLECIATSRGADNVPVFETFPCELLKIYFESYLEMCVYYECQCSPCYWARAAKISDEELAIYDENDRAQMKMELEWYMDAVLGRFASFDDVLMVKSFRIDISDMDSLPVHESRISRTYQLMMSDRDLSIANRWFERSDAEKEYIFLSIGLENGYVVIGKCEDESPFCSRWLRFCDTYPELAAFIWENTDREELLTVTNVPDRRRARMLKSTFEEMREYIEKVRPKGVTVDPTERALRNTVKRLRKVYLESVGELAVAESILARYLKERRANEQRRKAKEYLKIIEKRYSNQKNSSEISKVKSKK